MRNLRYLCLFIVGIILSVGSSLNAQIANFTASPSDGCVPLLVQFSNTSTGTISSYSWNLGNSVSSSLASPSTTYTAPGTYTVTLTVTGPGGSNTKTVTNFITVYASPVVSFTGTNLTGCTPLYVPFTSSITANAPGTVSYAWNYGDGGTGIAVQPAHSYTTPGTFNVTLTATSGKGCVASATQTNMVTAYATPVASFSGPLVYCKAPATVPFTSAGTAGCTVSWNFGDGSSAGTGSSVTHTYNTPGTFAVRMIATNAAGCSDTVIQNCNVLQTTNSATYSGPANICEGASATFNNTTSGATLPTSWGFGDGSTASGNAATHAYAAAGTYQVMMVTTTGSCPDTAFGACTVRPKPVPTITMSPAIPCSAPVSVTFTGGTGLAGGTYQWSWAGGGTGTGATVSHTYNTAVTDALKLVVTSPYGCKDSITYTPIIIRDIVVVKDYITPRAGCVPLTVSFIGAVLSGQPTPGPYPAGISASSWNFGDGNTSTAASPTHTYTTPGNYIATITLTTANGCTATDTVHIHVGTKVKPSFTIVSDSVCYGSVITATNTTSNRGSAFFFYTTNGGASIPAPANTTDIPADSTMEFWITLHSNNNGCEDTTSYRDSVVVKPPRAQFGDSLSCTPSTQVKFYDQSWRATQVWWTFGDGGTSSSFTPVHSYPTRGSYQVQLVAYNSLSGCYDTTQRTITMTGPTLGISCTDTAVCRGDVLHIIGSSNPPATAMGWAVDNIVQPRFTIDRLDSSMAVGYHTITFIATDRWGCVDSVRRPNYVIVSHPDAKFGNTPLLGCVPLLVTFTDSSTFTPGTAFGSRSWFFGDGSSSSSLIQPLQHTYTTSGIYSPMFIVRDFNGCADTLTKTNYLEVRHPVAAFSAPKTRGCIGEQMLFANSSSGATALLYQWSFGDGGTSGAAAPLHAYAATGSYTIRLIVTDSVLGCMDTLTRPAYITITKPVASFTLSDSFSICLPAVISGQSTSVNAASLLWDFGNANASLLANPILSYAVPGIYNVRLIAVNTDGCADTSAPTVVRVLGYNGALSYTPVKGCMPLTVHFKANIANLPNLIWDFADGSTNSTAKDSLTHTYNRPGTYLPRLIFSNNSGCKASSDGLDTIKVDAVEPDFYVTPPCVFNVVKLSDTSRSYFSPINFWKWDFGGGAIGTGPKVARSYSVAGQYAVTLTVRNAAGCTDSLVRKFNIYPLPTILVTPDTALCPPDKLALWVTGGRSYAWTPALSLSCSSCAAPVAAPVVPTTYLVVGTDSNGCSNKDSVHIGIQTKTSFVVNPGGDICLGQKFQLSAAGATSYTWTPSESLDNAESDAPTASPVVTTTYTVTAREGTCADASQPVTVIVDPLPTIDAGKDEELTAGNTVQLKATGTNVNRLEWDADPALSCLLCSDPIAAPKQTTTFHITAYTNKNCRAVDDVVVKVLCDKSQLFIPNSFTPNGDGLNDYFFPRSENIKQVSTFRVFSRWGELLYEQKDMATNDEYHGWNGTYKGKILPPDVYVYLIQADCDNGNSLLWKGDIMLLR